MTAMRACLFATAITQCITALRLQYRWPFIYKHDPWQLSWQDPNQLQVLTPGPSPHNLDTPLSAAVAMPLGITLSSSFPATLHQQPSRDQADTALQHSPPCEYCTHAWEGNGRSW